LNSLPSGKEGTISVKTLNGGKHERTGWKKRG